MRVLSVDIGIRNFAFTVYCTIESKFLMFRIVDLGKVKDYVAKMRELSSTGPFATADVILIERQMRACMKTMAVSLRAFNYEKTVMVAPQSIKRHFKTAMKKHILKGQMNNPVRSLQRACLFEASFGQLTVKLSDEFSGKNR